MKTKVALGIAALALAIVPAAAIAGKEAPDFGGKINKKPNRYIGFNVERNSNGKRVVNNAFLQNVPIDCPGTKDDGNESGRIDGNFRVRPDKTFGGTRSYPFTRPARRGGDPTGIKFTFKGEFTSGKRANGTVELTLFRDTGGDCHMKELPWRARKPAPAPPGGPILLP